MTKLRTFFFFAFGLTFLLGFLVGVWLGKQSPCSEVESFDIHKIPHAEDEP